MLVMVSFEVLVTVIGVVIAPELKRAVSPAAGKPIGFQLVVTLQSEPVAPCQVSVPAKAFPVIARATAGRRNRDCRNERKARTVVAVEGDILLFIEMMRAGYSRNNCIKA